jgi:hypothetical protein
MMDKKEKRAEERFDAHAGIIFSYFSTKNWAEERSVALNLSASGMCFESRHSFKPGADLYIRTGPNQDTVSGIDSWDLLRTSTLAEVRWCREMIREDCTCYSTGVKYI